MDCILNMRVVNTDADSYLHKTQEKSLVVEEREKKLNYLYFYLQQRSHFTPFFVSVHGMMGTKVEATLKLLASRPTVNSRQPYSRKCGYVQSRFSIIMVRATHHCIMEYQAMSSLISIQQSQWEYSSRLHFYQ